MKVLILHTRPPAATAPGRHQIEFDLTVPVRAIQEALPGAAVAAVRGEPSELIALLAKHQPDVVFNACEAPLGRGDLEAHCAALFEWLDVPFTGSGSEALALCRRKDLTAAVLAASGVPVPRRGGFPCIVKPASEDGSAGIRTSSICADADELQRARARIAGPVVVEEFLAGREFAVSLWGPRDPEWSTIGEVVFRNGLQLISYAAKWEPESRDYANSPVMYDVPLDDGLRDAILASARGAWKALGLRGYARVDVRLNADDVPCVLDVNPNPDLTPGSGIHRAAAVAGWMWPRFIAAQVEWALDARRPSARRSDR